MANEGECFGMEIKRCAKIIAIVGIILSVCSFNFISFVIYVLVYLGVDNNKPGYLLPAKICLLISLILIILAVVLSVILIILGIIAFSDDRVQAYAREYKPRVNEFMDNDLVQTEVKFSVFKFAISMITAFITIGYTILSYIVVSKARNYMLIENAHLSTLNPPEYTPVNNYA